LPKSFKIVYQRPNIEKPFFPITIIEAESEILDEEIMGPVFILYKAKDDKEAIKLANNTKYGNTSYIFSSKRGDEISEQLHCGSIFINQLGNINSNAPRGGIKSSGYGR
jgi:acyl-CoA reductase-like NAD-dependent aldehyde dehydrogenase